MGNDTGSERLTSREHWDGFWEGQARVFRPERATDVAIDRLFDRLLPLARKTERLPLRVLELGAGGSFWLGRLAGSRDCQAVGLDYSERGCALTQVSSPEPGVQVIRGDVFAPPLRAGQFDFVYSIGLIEHFEDPTTVLRQAFDMLAPGGCILTAIPNKAGLAGSVERVLNPENYNKHIPWKADALLSAHREAGFEEVGGNYFGPFELMGKLRDDSAASRALLRVKSAMNRLFFYPLYLRANFTAPSPILSAHLAAWGRRPASATGE